MAHQISADRVLALINHWRAVLLPIWATEKKVELYANGGPPPTEDDTCEDDIVPLGFAQTYMRKEFAVLLDPLLLDPGIVDAKLLVPAIKEAGRTLEVETHVNTEVNAVVNSRMANTFTNVAGRATITGRGVVYRKSKNDWVFKCGRMIHPEEAGVDLLDSEFREWAFAERLTLRDLDHRMKSASSGKYGWSKEGLETLKLWIMASEAEKYSKGSINHSQKWAEYYDPAAWLATDISDATFAKPTDVFWFFRKNGKITKDDPRYGGHEKVDLYCISRFGSESSIKREMKANGTELKWMVNGTCDDAKNHLKKLEQEYQRMATEDVKKRDECDIANERLLFYLPDAFDSIEQCLCVYVDDAAIAGEQTMMDVRGSGVTAMPKLSVMEGLLTSVIEGLTFGAQPHWTVPAGLSKEYLKQLERGGLQSGQSFPPGVQPMAKNNIFTGFNQAMGFVRMLDTGIAADSASANQGAFGGSQAEFAAQASAALAQQQSAMSRRLKGWFKFLTRVSEQVCRTLCRPWTEHKSEHPCYQDAMRLNLILQNRWEVHPDEWDSDRWVYEARQLAGEMMRQQSVAVNTQMIQVVGPIMPSAIPFFAKEILRATYGDRIASQIVTPPEEEVKSQTTRAQTNVAVAFVTGQVPEPLPMDDPQKHLEIAGQVAEGRIKAAQAAGETTQSEVVGIIAILGYAAKHFARMPEQIAEAGMKRMQELSQAIQSVPLVQPDPQMTPKEQADIEIKKANQDRLNQQLELQKTEKDRKTMIEMRKLSNAERSQSENEKNLAAQRAATYTQIEKDLSEANEPVVV